MHVVLALSVEISLHMEQLRSMKRSALTVKPVITILAQPVHLKIIGADQNIELLTFKLTHLLLKSTINPINIKLLLYKLLHT